MTFPPPELGWLGTPEEAKWPGLPESLETNPFVRYRKLLWSYQRALATGKSDSEFVEMVNRLDNQILNLTTENKKNFNTSPLIPLDDLAKTIGQTGGIWAKNETTNVAGSHKARHLFGLALHLEVEEVPIETPLSIASCGNAALAAAVIAKAANRPLLVHVPTWANEWILDHLEEMGAKIRICERQEDEPGDPCILRFRESVNEGALPFSCQGIENPWTIDGGRTLGFEIVDALSATNIKIDRLFAQVGGGAMATSVTQALTDAVNLGVLRHRPALNAVQSEGCAPLARAFNLVVETENPLTSLKNAFDNPENFMWPWQDPESSATGILDDITYDWIPLVWDMLYGISPGGPVIATEKDIITAHKLIQDHTDISADTTGTSGLAGLLSARKDGCIKAEESALILITGKERLN